MSGRILIVEDEADLAEGVSESLTAQGYRSEIAATGVDGLERACSGEHDLVILDVMLPGLDGYTLCRRLREAGHQVPVLFLTARGEPDDRVRGLQEGGDDYMPKPFELRELLLRVGAILRRTRWYERPPLQTVEFGGNRVDLRRYEGVAHDGARHQLTHKEALILKLLAEREGEVVSRDEILERVWGEFEYPTNRTVDNFILRLRRRFESDPSSPRHFLTVHRVGYRFRP